MNLRISGLFSVAAVAITGLITAIGAPPVHAQGTWSTEAPMPIAKAVAASGAINGQLYVVGGFDGVASSTVNEVYDQATNTWGTAAPILTSRDVAGAGTIGGVLYVAGGFLFNDSRIYTTNILEAYDSATNSWATKAAMPTPRYEFGPGVIDGIFYAVGGTGPCPPCIPLTTLEAYNPVTNSWATLAPMPTARRGLAAGVVNGVLYAVGGNIGGGGISSITYLDTVEAYNPVTNTWATKAPMPTARADLGVGVINNILYAVSGDNATGSINTVEAYDPTTDSWTTDTPIPTARSGPQPQTIAGALYVAGNGAAGAITTLEVFTPAVMFAGTPGFSNCHGQSVAALAQQYGGMKAAAAALGYPSVKALQTAIGTFCRV
jgi:N-acetylneuraminic acid mutarotase